MEPSLIQAWEAVVHRYDDSWSLGVVQERLDIAAIKSHGDAIPCLMLSGQDQCQGQCRHSGRVCRQG